MSANNRPLQALIVAKHDTRAQIIEQGLLDGGQVVAQRISLSADLQPRVGAIDPDVILIDLEEPDREELARLIELARWANRPVVVFADKTDSVTAEAASDAGVSAYVVDGLRRERISAVLEVAIARHRVFARLRTEASAAKEALEDRKLIEQAKSFLMRQKGLPEHEAYTLMRRAAMNQGIKLTQIARSLLTAARLVADVESK